ncbi:MAG: CHAT domain-containing protein [Phormidesmis sp. RL_2_1]|nr:CHAT domain-containing protein [Phormidesmis sp. RL_2_1]
MPNVELTWLVEPARSQLNDALWQQPWDILFFAGHSADTQGQQKLRINAQEALAISELKYALAKAVASGLKLAIFNACNGLQLIQDLCQDLCLPSTIVMRHAVADAVAQAFLKHFLSAFSQGIGLPQAVRQARERLQGLESQFPFATWLPVLCQNPVASTVTWPDFT